MFIYIVTEDKNCYLKPIYTILVFVLFNPTVLKDKITKEIHNIKSFIGQLSN